MVSHRLGRYLPIKLYFPFSAIKEIGMQEKQSKSIFASFNNIFANDASTKKPVSEMRPLNDVELRAVAGGPELEIGAGG